MQLVFSTALFSFLVNGAKACEPVQTVVSSCAVTLRSDILHPLQKHTSEHILAYVALFREVPCGKLIALLYLCIQQLVSLV